MMRGPWAAARPAMQAWKLPTPGTKSPSHVQRGAWVGRERHRGADALEGTHGGAHVAAAVVEDDDVGLVTCQSAPWRWGCRRRAGRERSRRAGPAPPP